jgi:tetratricopeptide (TPR) repeat protein
VPAGEELILAKYLSLQGNVSYEAGRYADAKPAYDRALAILEKALGPDHPHVALFLENYVVLLRKLDRTAEAQTMEVRAKTIQVTH